MTKEQYIKITDYFRQPGWKSTLMFFMCRFVPTLVANVYGILCVLALLANPMLLIRFVGVPLVVFVVVTVVRSIINRPRPFEKLGFSPINFANKQKNGKSFPSRHSASAAVIAMACMSLLPWLGWVMVILALIVAASRVLSGMHYISDVAVGLAFGLIVGIIGFYPLIF